MAAYNPSITPGDRLSFTSFLAIAFHAVVILGVTFTQAEKGPSTHTMEVTLASHRSQAPPDKADFLAQFNQRGSGTEEEKLLTSTTTRSDFHDNVIRETTPQVNPAPQVKAREEFVPNVVATIGKSPNRFSRNTEDEPVAPIDDDSSPSKSLLERSLEIASLEAKLDQQRQIYAGRPRIKRLTSVSTRASVDAYYLNSWKRKIETIGNLNYPEEARRRKLYGSLRLMVSILPGGQLKEVEILESSGHRVLDEAAIRIVQLSAPFAPFPDELRETTDVLEIIRTWQFRKNSSLRSF